MTISLKNIEISKRNTIFQGADFRNFRKSGVPKVWTHHYTRFFMEISKKSIRKAYLQANERLWANYIFYRKSKFLKICFPDRKMDFLRGGPIFGEKNGNRNRDEPEPDRTGTGLNRSRPKPNRTEPNRGLPVNIKLYLIIL